MPLEPHVLAEMPATRVMPGVCAVPASRSCGLDDADMLLAHDSAFSISTMCHVDGRAPVRAAVPHLPDVLAVTR